MTEVEQLTQPGQAVPLGEPVQLRMKKQALKRLLIFSTKLPEEPVIKSMGFYFIYGFDCYIKAPME